MRPGRAPQGTDMNRQDLLLCILAAANGQAYEPVQIQKAAFLVNRNVPHLIDAGPNYNFVPYDYGPFDREVYSDASMLSLAGLAIIGASPRGRWNTYAASAQGLNEGTELLRRIKPAYRDYIEKVSAWVLGQSFGSLVRSIYDKYPEMKQNSIFQG
jgi:hypothetical protein